MSRLGLGLGISKGGLIPFNPLSLDPYLFFDSRSSMIGTLENPTLDLDPANPETLDVITATRAGVATYTDADGLIQSASPNTTRVDYTQGAELTPTKYQQLEQTGFSLWAHARTSGTANAAISPDGQNNATYVEQNAGQTNAGSIYRFDAAVTGVFTLSVYAKKKEKDFVVLYDSNVGRTYFNLDTGTVGTVASGNTANIEDAGNGWFRCSTTFTASSGGVKAFYVGDNDNSLVVTDGGGIYVWGPQLEEGTTASDFVANTTGSPKFIASATYGPRVPMILVEPSATNLLPYSEDFSNAAWDKNNVTLTADYGIAPDGTNTSTRIEYSGTSYIQDSFAVSDYTVSAFVKGVAGEVVKFGIGANVGQGAEFTLNGEWQRIQHTGTGGAIFFSSLGGNTATDFEIWGAQVETGSLTSYIPTSGGDAAARTRAADDLVISGSAFSSFFNTGGDGTFYAEFVPRDVLSEQWYLLAGQSYNRRFMYTNDGNARLNAYDGATTRSYGVDMVANQINRAAFTYTATTQEASIDGAVTSPVAHNGNYSTTSRLHLASPANDKQMNGHIKRVLFWPYSSDRL